MYLTNNDGKLPLISGDCKKKHDFERHVKHNKSVQREIFEELDNQYQLSNWSNARMIKSIYRLALERFEERPIIMYGAGTAATYTLLKMHDCFLFPIYICDSDKNKHNTEVEGIQIISPDNIMDEYKDAYIVISSNDYLYEIFDQLCAMGFPKESIYRAP